MSRSWGVRGRLLLEGWFAVVVVVAVVVAAVGGVATYTAYVSPGTTTEQRQVSSWEATGTYELAATVSEPNPLYPVGTELADRPAYFLSVSPSAEGRFSFGYEASDGGSVDVTIQQVLVLRAIESGSDGGPVEYWRLTEPLGAESETGVAPGERVDIAFERNVSATYDRMAGISERLGGTPGTTQLLVVSTVEFAGTVNGDDIDRTATYRLPIEVSGTTYQPGAVAGDGLDGSTTERITRQRTYGPLYRVGGPAALSVGLVAVAGLAYGRYDDRFTVSAAERTTLEFESTREEFDDWITTARLPEAVLARPRVEVHSLSGLVDTAIDIDARVFETPTGDAFYVVDEGILYVYESPTAGLDATLGGDGDTDVGEGVADTGDAESPDDRR
jgi:hypothetical protein